MVLTELTIPQLSLETAIEYSRTILAKYYLDHVSRIRRSSIIPVFDGIIKREEDIIIPFVFDPYIEAGNTSGAYWIIQPGGSNTVQHNVSPDFKLEVKPRVGKGWLLGWKRGVGVKVWPCLEKKDFEQITTFDHNWVVCFIANPEADIFIVEGVETPEYKPEYEETIPTNEDVKVIDSDGTFWCGLGEFWAKYHELKNFSSEPLTCGPGR